MHLNVKWHKPMKLRKCKDTSTSIYELDLQNVPTTSGVYVFVRKFGKDLKPLYIGKALNLRTRINQQLGSLKLMRGIQNSASGLR